jgi:hypothetical protein
MRQKDVQLAIKLTLTDVQKQFEVWRSTKRRRAPIPEELWQAAVALFPGNSVQELSKALHLSHADLKRRVLAKQTDIASEAILTPGFVELDIGHSVSPLECIFEMENASGAKTKLSVKGTGFDLMGLADAFWGKAHS